MVFLEGEFERPKHDFFRAVEHKLACIFMPFFFVVEMIIRFDIQRKTFFNGVASKPLGRQSYPPENQHISENWLKDENFPLKWSAFLGDMLIFGVCV